ncbi:hypothetical protein RJ640_013276 [Escallonia rubra]|uniref:TIR domain-containing protein n=1 Tax=Escallonia rubra TaxID=112253 RepID=A0AA88QZH7_9ASTE|nr:hypothetical protein RJ640_013276 [Escallonia rubra]
MAAQEAPSFASKYRYDVFLSFRGGDTCGNFANCLLEALVAAGLHPFRDDEDLELGECISSALERSVQGSRIWILVLSGNYASSAWCLDELLSILRLRETRGVVLPVFYHVDLAGVRRVQRQFAEAIASLEERRQDDDIKVKGWKKGLEESANLAGFFATPLDTSLLRIQLSSSSVIRPHPPRTEFNANEEKQKTEASSSAQEAPSFTSNYTYDVFLSFRGEDTRKKFAKDLHEALVAAGLHPFSDDEGIKPGEDIGSELRKAIQGSRIWILVLSENYASSTWCLDELICILELRQLTGWGAVLPVFYHVEPIDVRSVQGQFALAIAVLKERFKEDDIKVNGWKKALEESAYLAGLFSHPYDISDSKLIENIVKHVQKTVIREKKGEDYRRLLGIQPSNLSLTQTHPPSTELNATEEKQKTESSSSASKYVHDVFLSFVEDSGNDFIHKLYEALVAAKFRTFRDKNDRESGSGVTSAVEESIKSSRISLNYACSPGCLDKLLKILELRKMKKHAILPIFYDVTPSQVAKQEGVFEISFSGYDRQFKENKVNNWRAALAEAGRVKGVDFPNEKYR